MSSRWSTRWLRLLPALLALTGCMVGKRPTPYGDERSPLAVDASTLFVPVVLSSTGAEGSFFTSEMTLTNRGTTTATIAYTYTAQTGGGTGTATDTIAAGTQRVVPDAIEYLRGLGVPIPATGNRVGTLRAAFGGLSSPSAGAITVRTSTPVPVGSAPTGRAGLAYAGVPAYQLLTGTSWLCGLRQTGADRSNVAVQNAGSAGQGDLTLRATFYAGDGSSAGGSAQVTLSPGGFHQWRLTEIASAAANGYVKVEVVAGTAPYYAYAVINDNANSDGSFVTPLVESSLLSRGGLSLPVVVENPTYSTEVVLTNFGSVSRQLTLAFVSEVITSADDAATTSITLAPGEQLIIPAYVQYLREQHVAGVPAAGPTFVGSLFATPSGGDVSGLFLGGRTVNPGGGGRYGLFYVARPFGTSAGASEAWLYGLQQDAENRTNLALLATGETDTAPVTLRVELFDGATGSLAATVEGAATTLAARQFTQISAILQTYAPNVRQGYARVTRTGGANGFVAYAVVNDGGQPGQRSGDGAFVAMSLDTSLSVTFSGTWNNTTFGSSGAASLVISGDTYTQQYTSTSTLGGNVFGSAAPPAEHVSGVFTLAGGTFAESSAFFGNSSTTVTPDGRITGALSDIPSPSVSRTTFTGTIVPPSLQAQTITIDSTIFFRAGGSAQCVATLNRRP